MISAVVFDLDGVIVDSEQVWDDVREEYVRETGGIYTDRSARDMMGMSSPEPKFALERAGAFHLLG